MKIFKKSLDLNFTKNIMYYRNSLIPVLKKLYGKFIIFIRRIKSPNVRIGIGCMIDAKSRFDYQVMLDDYTRIFDSSFGRFSYIGPYSICINSDIGNFTSIGPGVKIGLGIHPLDKISTSPYFYDSSLYRSFVKAKVMDNFDKTIIGHDVWIGANVMIAGGVKIGNGAIIGAGAFVNKDVDPYSIVVGIPAKVLKYRFKKETIDSIEKSKWWNWNITNLEQNASIFLQKESFLDFISNIKEQK